MDVAIGLEKELELFKKSRLTDWPLALRGRRGHPVVASAGLLPPGVAEDRLRFLFREGREAARARRSDESIFMGFITAAKPVGRFLLISAHVNLLQYGWLK